MTGRWELIAYRFNELAIVALSNSMMTIPTLELLRFLPFEMEPSPINPLITPLSKTYGRTDFGSFGRVCERTKGANATKASTAWRVVARSFREDTSEMSNGVLGTYRLEGL